MGVMLVSQGVNWENPTLTMSARFAFMATVGSLVFVMYQIQGKVQARAESDEEYRNRKVWVRQKPAKSFMASFFGDDGSKTRPKASEVSARGPVPSAFALRVLPLRRPRPAHPCRSQYQPTTEAVLESSAATKAMTAVFQPALMAMGASFFFGVQFMLLMQMVNVPFTMMSDRLLSRHFWPVFMSGDDAAVEGDVSALFAEPMDLLFADPTVVPPTLQVLRRKARARRLASGGDADAIPADGADPSEGLGGPKRAAGRARLTADGEARPGGADAPGPGADGDADEEEVVSYGEGYDEVMEDVVFSAWEDDEAVNVRAAEALRESGKDLSYAADDDGWTLLMVACGSRATPQRAVERLMELGCRAEAADREGWTALHWAAKHDCPQAVRGVGRWMLGGVLRGQKGDAASLIALVRAESDDGRTAEDLAEAEGNDAAAAALRAVRLAAEEAEEGAPAKAEGGDEAAGLKVAEELD